MINDIRSQQNIRRHITVLLALSQSHKTGLTNGGIPVTRRKSLLLLSPVSAETALTS